MNDLLAAIRAAPDDDAPRLVYADALLERGDLRGELITMQCALAKGGLPRERAIHYRRRSEDLLAQHERDWAFVGMAEDWAFRRGFLEEVWIDASEFLKWKDAILDQAPLLRFLHLTSLDGSETTLEDSLEILDAVLDVPGIDGLATTFVDPQYQPALSEMDVEIVRRLRASGRLAKLVELSLYDFSAETLHVLTTAPEAARIQSLELRGLCGPKEGWTDNAREGLQTHRTALRPRKLTYHGADHHSFDHELAKMADHDFLSRVEDLSIDDAALGTTILSRLRRLNAAKSIADADWQWLTQSNDCRLEELRTGLEWDSHFWPRERRSLDLEPLFDANLPHLRVLGVERCSVSPGAAKKLLRSRLAQQLEVIDLRGNDLEASEFEDAWDGILIV